RGPRRQHRDEPHHRRQEKEQEAQAVDAEKVIGPDRRNPRGALDELVGGAPRIEPDPQRNRDEEPDERREVRDPADRVLVVLADQEDQQRAHERLEQDDGQQMIGHTVVNRYRTNRYTLTNANTPRSIRSA